MPDNVPKHAERRAGALPPGPALAPWRQTLELFRRPEQFLRDAHEEHGDVFTLRTKGFGDLVVLAGPDAVREVFTGPPDVLLAGASNAPLSVLVGERSVLVLDGAEHLRQRKLLLPPFHGSRLAGMARLVERATLRELEGWPVRGAVSLLEPMQTITLEVIVRVVFGVREGARFDALCLRLREVLAPMGGRMRALVSVLSGGDGGPEDARFAARRAAVDELLYAEIAPRRRAPDLGDREDVLSMLLLAADEDGVGMTDVEVRDELMTLLLAGHETTATGLAWTFERVVRHPAVQAELRAELERGEHVYADAVVKESLRVRPVLPNVGRVLSAPWTLMGHELPAGTVLMPSIALQHRRESSFPSADEFRPERFLGPDAPSGSAWIPFGGGVRRCLGASFALLEMRVVLQTVLGAGQLQAVGGDEAVVRRGITLTPEAGARVRWRPRADGRAAWRPGAAAPPAGRSAPPRSAARRPAAAA